MQIVNKSIEVLLGLEEEELQDDKESDDVGNFSNLIAVYEALYKKVLKNKDRI
ncbi:hypothetical protein BN1058_00866 [Paraliobacillus sp. PM-2]|uniref:hypothetical protein n=1 Tax=Paraliobacillus sp. PM-2 TaxID=1462524 RepID=UPI00061C4779|nr:hypothetical protein [Paraliobacillus sp. PM-2]CQR46597.1 hypothetical protein BN1058_00866 [Paraliobacillus sp. PM-2]